MADISFEEIVRAWLLEYDDRIPGDRLERREAFAILLGNLNIHNFNKEDLTSSRREKIVRSCVNPFHRDRNKLKKWSSIVVNDLDAAILVYYGSIKIDRDVITQEMKDKFKSLADKAEETKALRGPTEPGNAIGDEGSKPLDLSEEPLDLEENSPDLPVNVKSDPRVIEATNEILDSMEGPEPVWDEDLMKELGVDFNE